MKIAVIQDRPILCYDGEYYLMNPVDVEKYLRLCDQLIYCASADYCNNGDKIKRATKIDTSRVKIKLVRKEPLREFLVPSLHNKSIVKDIINDNSVDTIVIKVPSITIGRVAYSLLQKSDKKYVLEVIGCAWDSYWHHGIKGKLMSVFSYLTCKRMVANSKNVIYVTSGFLQKRYPNKYHTIGCSNVFIQQPSEDDLLRRMARIQSGDMPGSILRIGTAGAIDVRYKGQQYVIKAVSRLKKQGRIVHYYLAGAGSKEYLEGLAKRLGVINQIHFLGMIPKKEMDLFYDNLDIYVHPSMAEGLPRVVIEAERKAVPTIGAKASGTPELLDPDCVFRIRNVNDICAVLLSFDKDKLMRVSTNNFNRAAQYAIDVLDSRRRSFFNSLI